MSITIENTSNLGRRATIVVPADQVEAKYKAKLDKLSHSKNVQIKGFRPGKATPDAIEKVHGDSLRGEAIDEAINASLPEHFKSENITPAGTPVLEKVNAEKGKPLEYVVSFEVFPEIKLVDFKKYNVEKPNVSITEADIEKTLEGVRKQQQTFDTVDRAAQKGDLLDIDFEGFLDDKPFVGGKAEHAKLIIGENRFIPGFEDELIGAKTGEQRDIHVTFPEEYHAKDLAGKPAKFSVKVHEIKQPILPELNDEFLQRLGITDGSVETLKNKVKNHMETELARAIRSEIKNQIFKQLVELHQFDVPSSLVAREAEYLHHEMHRHEHQGKEVKLDHGSHEHPELVDQATRRVSISLIVHEIIKQNDIKLDPEKLSALIKEASAVYEKPDLLEKYIMENQQMLARYETEALEQQVIDLVLSKAKTTDKNQNYNEFMQINT
ncbi:MAG: trigger factor [Gammaproteobacteria bacterium]